MELREFAFALFFAASATAHAMSFGGAITQTITSSNDPRYTIGSVYHGWYQYESDASDGTFYAIPFGYAASYPQYADLLTGSLYAGQSRESNPLNESAYLSYITVSSGVVIDFHWEDQRGWTDPLFTGSTFMFYEGGPSDPPLIAQGTLRFSVPVEKVPESGVTVVLICMSIASLYVIGHFDWSKKPKVGVSGVNDSDG